MKNIKEDGQLRFGKVAEICYSEGIMCFEILQQAGKELVKLELHLADSLCDAMYGIWR